jgi:hypothetical protein
VRKSQQELGFEDIEDKIKQPIVPASKIAPKKKLAQQVPGNMFD